MASNVRMRFGRASSCTSACSRAIRHRIIRGQVRCGSQVFYFRDIQRVPVPRASLLFALRVVDSFFAVASSAPILSYCFPELVRQCNRVRNSTTNEPCETHPLQILFFLFFLRASGCEQVVIISCASHIVKGIH